MKSELKRIINTLNPKLLEVDKIHIGSFRKLGVGEGNLNYIFETGDRKFVCRVNIDKGVPDKSQNEFDALKRIENLRIAPKPFYYHPKDKKFPFGFVILEFIEGKPFRMKKRTYTKKQIQQLAFLLAQLHSTKYEGFKKQRYLYLDYVKKIEEHNKKINANNNKLTDKLETFRKRILEFLPTEEHKFSLIHGDICPQNIVETKSGLKLIDWESLRCCDPAKDIANILIELELKGEDLEVFLKNYHQIRKDPTILKRAKTYAVLLRAEYFLWELTRSFEIINKELPKEYLAKTTSQLHINEAKFQYRKLRKLIDVPNVNVDSLFSD